VDATARSKSVKCGQQFRIFVNPFLNELYALVLAHISNMIINGDMMEKTITSFVNFKLNNYYLRFAILAPMVGTCLWEVYLGTKRWSGKTGMDSERTSYAAHVAGGFTGIFLGTIVLRNIEEQDWEIIVRRVFCGVYVVAFGSVLVMSAMESIEWIH